MDISQYRLANDMLRPRLRRINENDLGKRAMTAENVVRLARYFGRPSAVLAESPGPLRSGGGEATVWAGSSPGGAQYWPESPHGGVSVITIEPTGHILGATVRGIDLSEPLSDANFAAILQALGAHGVLHFPDQKLEARALRDFSQRFGRIQATLTGRHHEPGMPEVGILSNIIENGEPIGITDAGQDWHTDMSYNETIGFLNVLYAVKVPRRDGRVLGATMFVNTQAAYEDLAPEIKARLRPRRRRTTSTSSGRTCAGGRAACGIR